MNSNEFKSGTFGGVDLAGHTMSEVVNRLRPVNAPEVKGEPRYGLEEFTWKVDGWTVTVHPELGQDDAYAVAWRSPDSLIRHIEADGRRHAEASGWEPANEHPEAEPAVVLA